MGKKSKSFLPKRIAGVKVPKSVRKGRFGELLASPTGQKLLAEAIVAVGAAAGAAGGAKKVKDSPGARDAFSAAGEAVRDKGGEARDVLAYALGEAARSFAEAIRRHEGDGGHEELAAGESKKKPISYEAGPL